MPPTARCDRHARARALCWAACCRSGSRSRCCRSRRARSWRSRGPLARAACCRGCADGRWALIPPLSVIAFVFVTRAAEDASAQGSPTSRSSPCPCSRRSRSGGSRAAHDPGAALARAAAVRARMGRPRGSRRPGRGARLDGAQLRRPRRAARRRHARRAGWRAGIIAMALADTALVVSDLLQRPNNALNAAHPAAGLPRLQSAALRLRRDGLWRPVHRGCARRTARGRDRGAARSCAARCSWPRSRSASTCCSCSWTSSPRPCRSRSRSCCSASAPAARDPLDRYLLRARRRQRRGRPRARAPAAR